MATLASHGRKVLRQNQAICPRGAMMFLEVLHLARLGADTPEEIAEGAVAMAEAAAAAVVDRDALAEAGALAEVAAVTEAEVDVVMAAEVVAAIPVAVAACLAKAIPRAAVTDTLFALQHGV
jgi:hypothetical protein